MNKNISLISCLLFIDLLVLMSGFSIVVHLSSPPNPLPSLSFLPPLHPHWLEVHRHQIYDLPRLHMEQTKVSYSFLNCLIAIPSSLAGFSRVISLSALPTVLVNTLILYLCAFIQPLMLLFPLIHLPVLCFPLEVCSWLHVGKTLPVLLFISFFFTEKNE